MRVKLASTRLWAASLQRDGSLVIEHDIGEPAAEHGGMGNMETLIEGSRVRFGTVAHDDEKGGQGILL
jgi:hypothetical protein